MTISGGRAPQVPTTDLRFADARVVRSSQLRIILIGADKMARHHASAIRHLGDTARIVAVADPSPGSLAAMAAFAPGAVLEPDLARLLAELCTAPAHHSAGAVTALLAGLHVYAEKPFALTEDDATAVLDLAEERGLSVCAGHQLLFEAPSRKLRELLPVVGRIVHMESYFAFRPVGVGRDGQPALSVEAQLIDVLPHPVYLLLAFLEQAAPGDTVALEKVSVGRGGTVHVLLRCGDVTGMLVVTLTGQPVENFLRVVGTNGSLNADYVRGTVQRVIGPGASGIDKALAPYRLSGQFLSGTTAALGRRILNRQRSYPGLVEILESFHDSIRGLEEWPMTPVSIRDTVRVCQRITKRLRPVNLPSHGNLGSDEVVPRVLVTRGTGFLGREILRQLAAGGVTARSVSRRPPPTWDTLAAVDYRVADLAETLDAGILNGVETVIHCAAETVGGWDAHARNSADATEKLLRAAAESGVRGVVYISSIAILTGPDPLTEASPLNSGKEAGPYVWGKATAERRARELGQELGLRVTVLRPGALVDWRQLEPPGKLGRRLGILFVTVGGRKDTLGIVDVADAARMSVWAALEPDRVPEVLNIVDPTVPTKAHLMRRLREMNPGLRVVWLPRAVLWPLSWLATGVQKVLRPGRPAINVAKVFAKRSYDAGLARNVWDRMRTHKSGGNSLASPEGAESLKLTASPATVQ